MSVPRPWRVLDCSLRDGGFVNGWRFEPRLARRLVRQVDRAGVDYIEVGYRTSAGVFEEGQFGPFRFITDRLVEDLAEQAEARICVMAELGRVRLEEIPPKSASRVDVYRVALFWKQLREALPFCAALKERGYEVYLNLVQVSTLSSEHVSEALELLREASVDGVYVVDTFGAMDPEAVASLISRYVAALPGKRIGLHAHNNRQLAYANALVAIERGATLIDGTVLGIGRAAGNCPLELLLTTPRQASRSTDVRPLLDLVEDDILPLQRKHPWGYHLPYFMTATTNQHHKFVMPPRALAQRRFDQQWDALLEGSLTGAELESVAGG